MHIYQLTPKDLGSVCYLQRLCYPPAFIEEKSIINDILKSTDLSFGLRDTMFNGCLLVKPGQTHEMDDKKYGVYIYDISIHPWRRGEGLASWLLEQFFKEAGKMNLDVFLNCRYTSYPIFNNETRLNRWGYKIVEDTFIQDFYKQWDIEESANYLHLTKL